MFLKLGRAREIFPRFFVSFFYQTFLSGSLAFARLLLCLTRRLTAIFNELNISINFKVEIPFSRFFPFSFHFPCRLLRGVHINGAFQNFIAILFSALGEAPKKN